MNEEKKCNGYESMFVFLNEEDFQKHLQTCEECQKEHERMQKISNLVKEAKPCFKEKKQKKTMLKAICAVFTVATLSLSYPIYTIGTDMYEKAAEQSEENSLTAEEIGLPVDEYGFVYID